MAFPLILWAILTACGGSGGAPVVLGEDPPVTLSYGFSGPVGGPFATSVGASEVLSVELPNADYRISSDQVWLKSSTSDLPSGGKEVAISVDGASAPTEVGSYLSKLTLEDTATGSVVAIASVSLQVLPPIEPDVHPFTGLPLTADGWTDLRAMVARADAYLDCRIVYVSSSTGQDTTEDIYYSPGSPLVGDDPFRPVGAVSAYGTLQRAYQVLRDGHSDLMLLKRGDVWIDDPTFQVSKGGKSQSEPLMIAAYGSSGDLPIRRTVGSAIFANEDDAPGQHVLIADIQHEPASPDAEVRSIGVNWAASVDGLMIEGCRFFGYQSNLLFHSVEALGNPVINNVTLRRNIVADAWSSTSHSQGIYTDQVRSFLIEENVFDHNGWRKNTPGAEATIFNRNMYLNRSPLMTVRGNIDARGASGGIQQRMGGVNEQNLSLQNPLGIDFGHAKNTETFGGTIRENVVLDARDVDAQARGFGITIGHGAVGVEVYDNIVAHQRTGSGNIVAIRTQNESSATYGGSSIAKDTVLRDNIVYAWDDGGTGGIAVSIGQSTDGITVTDNVFVQPSGAKIMGYNTGTMHSGPDESWVFSGNHYAAGSSITPFVADNVDLTLGAWTAAVGESNATEGSVAFSAPGRDIASYAAHVGLSASSYQDALELFLAQARSQSRYSWRAVYTSRAVINYVRAGFDKGELPSR